MPVATASSQLATTAAAAPPHAHDTCLSVIRPVAVSWYDASATVEMTTRRGNRFAARISGPLRPDQKA
jgi:hypothetical protein